MSRISKLNIREKAALLKTRFMASLTPTSSQRMTEIASAVTYDAREILFHEGQEAEFFYCVLIGYVRLCRLSGNGREADIRICGPGDIFAESLLYGGDHYRYDAQAAEQLLVARFDLAKARELVEAEKDINRAVMHSLSAHLIDVMQCVANDRLQTAQQRVAHYLLKECEEKGGPVSLRLPFQKSLLARKLGLAPEALSRAFSSLRPSGVAVRGRTIRIDDVSALRND